MADCALDFGSDATGGAVSGAREITIASVSAGKEGARESHKGRRGHRRDLCGVSDIGGKSFLLVWTLWSAPRYLASAPSSGRPLVRAKKI